MRRRIAGSHHNNLMMNYTQEPCCFPRPRCPEWRLLVTSGRDRTFAAGAQDAGCASRRQTYPLLEDAAAAGRATTGRSAHRALRHDRIAAAGCARDLAYGPCVILPKVRDPRFITVRRGGTLTDADQRLWPPGRPRAQSTFCTSSSRCSPRIRGPARRSSRLGHGRAARSRCLSPARRLATPMRPPRKVRRRALAGSSASGSATSSRRRFASLFWTTSGSETTSAGRCSTADRLSAPTGTAQHAHHADAPQPQDSR